MLLVSRRPREIGSPRRAFVVVLLLCGFLALEMVMLRTMQGPLREAGRAIGGAVAPSRHLGEADGARWAPPTAPGSLAPTPQENPTQEALVVAQLREELRQCKNASLSLSQSVNAPCHAEERKNPRTSVTHPLVDRCLAVKNAHPQDGGVVFLQYLDWSYISMTKSWICNVMEFPGVLPRTVFVAVDRVSYQELVGFSRSQVESTGRPPLHVELMEFIPSEVATRPEGGNLDYGTKPYYELMLFRSGLNYQLLRMGISIFLVESDAVWHADPTAIVLQTKGDIVSLNDVAHNGFRWVGKHVLCHGFSLWRASNPRIIKYMEALLAWQENLVNTAGKHQIGDTGNEQFYMMKLLSSEFSDVSLSILPQELFANGRKYDDKSYTTAIVRHNNYVVGNAAKVERARRQGYWYLSEDNTTCIAIPKPTSSPNVASNITVTPQ